MDMLFPPDLPQCQTSLIVVCKDDYSEVTIEDICSSDKFSEQIKVYISSRSKKIIHLSISPTLNREKQFEKKKFEFIESLSNICSYISITYDNQTINYMKEISESVYVLEREFRTLIEIIFLRELGVNWYDGFFQNKEKEKDRKKGRDNVLEYLNNPLDSLDFVHLKNFVEERINLSNNTIFDRLNAIESALNSDKFLNNNHHHLNEITILLQEIRDISKQKKAGLQISNLYRHITSELASEWKELYDFRNTWAHNHCLMTRNELENYRELASSVLKKIRTEITLLSLLEKEQEFKIQSNLASLVLINFSKFGTPYCKLRMQINSKNQQHILEVNEATYIDVFLILQVISEFTDFNHEAIELDYLKLNPFLIEYISDYGNSLFDTVNFKDKIETNLHELESILLEANPSYILKKIEGTIAYMKEDVDILLKDIFKNNDMN